MRNARGERKSPGQGHKKNKKKRKNRDSGPRYTCLLLRVKKKNIRKKIMKHRRHGKKKKKTWPRAPSLSPAALRKCTRSGMGKENIERGGPSATGGGGEGERKKGGAPGPPQRLDLLPLGRMIWIKEEYTSGRD